MRWTNGRSAHETPVPQYPARRWPPHQPCRLALSRRCAADIVQPGRCPRRGRRSAGASDARITFATGFARAVGRGRSGWIGRGAAGVLPQSAGRSRCDRGFGQCRAGRRGGDVFWRYGAGRAGPAPGGSRRSRAWRGIPSLVGGAARECDHTHSRRCRYRFDCHRADGIADESRAQSLGPRRDRLLVDGVTSGCQLDRIALRHADRADGAGPAGADAAGAGCAQPG